MAFERTTRVRPSVVDEDKNKASKEDKKPPASVRAAAARARRATSSATKPPARINPGWVHKAVATKILQTLQSRITVETGEPFDVGELPSTDTLAREGNVIDDRQPVDLLSRILAHIMYRIPGMRKIEKSLEGKETSSGPISDLVAFFAQLYTRNETTFDAVRHQMMEQARAGKNAPTNGGVSNVPV